VQIDAVDVGDTPAAIRTYATEHAISLPMLRDPQGEVWRRLSGKGSPLHATWTGAELTVEVSFAQRISGVRRRVARLRGRRR